MIKITSDEFVVRQFLCFHLRPRHQFLNKHTVNKNVACFPGPFNSHLKQTNHPAFSWRRIFTISNLTQQWGRRPIDDTSLSFHCRIVVINRQLNLNQRNQYQKKVDSVNIWRIIFFPFWLVDYSRSQMTILETQAVGGKNITQYVWRSTATQLMESLSGKIVFWYAS